MMNIPLMGDKSLYAISLNARYLDRMFLFDLQRYLHSERGCIGCCSFPRPDTQSLQLIPVLGHTAGIGLGLGF